MTKTAKALNEDLIEHACSQLGAIARKHVIAGKQPAEAAWAAIRETKTLFPHDWKLAVQGDGDEDEVEVWEVEHKYPAACARIQRESQSAYRNRLVKTVKERAKLSADPVARRVAKWSSAKLLDLFESTMPATEEEAFRTAVAAAARRR
jgi:hypothetical protein